MAVSASFPSNILKTDDSLERYEWVIRDNLVVRDLSKVILWMTILMFDTVSCEYVPNNVTIQPWWLLYTTQTIYNRNMQLDCIDGDEWI